jgi:hypothetical protein
MAMRLFLLLWFGLAASTCFGKDGCTEPTEYQPVLCPIKLPKIANVRIEENGARSPGSDAEAAGCSRFRLTPKSVRRYFSAAWEANESDAHHTLDWSPCYAAGTLTFVDGKSAHWSISQAGTGSLSPDEGRQLFLYCPTCKRRPFKQ